MSRKPNDTTARKPSAQQAGKKETAGKRKSKPNHDTGDEETPITISGGSIVVESLISRKETGILSHKKCKISNVASNKVWTIDRVDIYGPGMSWPDTPLQSVPITDPKYTVSVVFKRPA